MLRQPMSQPGQDVWRENGTNQMPYFESGGEYRKKECILFTYKSFIIYKQILVQQDARKKTRFKWLLCRTAANPKLAELHKSISELLTTLASSLCEKNEKKSKKMQTLVE